MNKARSAYSISSKKEKFDTHIIVVWVDNEAGVLARIAGLFSGRGYNIESLAVAEVDKKLNISRITIVTTGTPQVINQIRLQLKKLIPVHKVATYPIDDTSIFRELALIKFVSESDTLKKAEQLCIDLNSIILDKTPKSFIAQYLGTRREVDSFIKKIKPLGAISISRSGALAMKKGPETVKDNKGKVL